MQQYNKWSYSKLYVSSYWFICQLHVVLFFVCASKLIPNFRLSNKTIFLFNPFVTDLYWGRLKRANFKVKPRDSRYVYLYPHYSLLRLFWITSPVLNSADLGNTSKLLKYVDRPFVGMNEKTAGFVWHVIFNGSVYCMDWQATDIWSIFKIVSMHRKCTHTFLPSKK